MNFAIVITASLNFPPELISLCLALKLLFQNLLLRPYLRRQTKSIVFEFDQLFMKRASKDLKSRAKMVDAPDLDHSILIYQIRERDFTRCFLRRQTSGYEMAVGNVVVLLVSALPNKSYPSMFFEIKLYSASKLSSFSPLKTCLFLTSMGRQRTECE